MEPKDLWRRAEQLTRYLRVQPRRNNVEVLWTRRYGQLSSVHSFVAYSLTDALEHVIAEEESALLRRAHGEACPCDDCCIDRVDGERRARRRG